MLMPRRRTTKPKKVVKKRKPQPIINFEKSETGTASIKINTDADTYMSFGKDDNIKWVHIRFCNGQCYVSKMYPIAMLSLPAEVTKSIGTKNIARIRELIRANLKGGILPRKRLMKIGATINKEYEQRMHPHKTGTDER